MSLFGSDEDLSRPARSSRWGAHFDPDAFGRFSESLARFLGTGRFLVGQTVVVSLWITLNVAAVSLQWDPYPFILLNLAFSTQAAYAAPLILLAQNRQDERDRAQAERDREVNFRTQTEAEFVARELAAVRMSMSDVATIDELRSVTNELLEGLARLEERLPAPDEPPMDDLERDDPPPT